MDIDQDLLGLTQNQLISEIKKLRAAIRKHRDASRHELCWHHPELWSLLPEKLAPEIAIPEWPQFMQGCIKYRKSLDDQASKSPRTSDEYNEDIK